jgi:hypothetical protein
MTNAMYHQKARFYEIRKSLDGGAFPPHTPPLQD